MKAIDTDEYAGTSLIGKLGVEAAYEQQLHGKRGSREILVNAAGRPIEKKGEYTPQLAVHPPVAGEDLILGLDVRVQKVAESSARGQARLGGRPRSENRRRHRARQHAGVRPE
jgi:penicillin-binding protein 2